MLLTNAICRLHKCIGKRVQHVDKGKWNMCSLKAFGNEHSTHVDKQFVLLDILNISADCQLDLLMSYSTRQSSNKMIWEILNNLIRKDLKVKKKFYYTATDKNRLIYS